MEIRVATGSDLESLADTFAPDLSKAQLEARLEESRSGVRTMLVAIKEGRAVGVVSIGGARFQRRGSLRLFALDVAPAYQRKGVGTALLNAVENIAPTRNLQTVNLEVATDNTDAIRLYRRLGYRQHGKTVMDRWRRILDDGTTDMIQSPAFVMVKQLDCPSCYRTQKAPSLTPQALLVKPPQPD